MMEDTPASPMSSKRSLELSPYRRMRLKTPFGALIRVQFDQQRSLPSLDAAPPDPSATGDHHDDELFVSEEHCPFLALSTEELKPWEDCPFYEIKDDLVDEDLLEVEKPLYPSWEEGQRYFHDDWTELEENGHMNLCCSVSENLQQGGSTSSTATPINISDFDLPTWGVTPEEIFSTFYAQETADGTYFSLSPKKKKPGRDLSEKDMTPKQRKEFHGAKDTEWTNVTG